MALFTTPQYVTTFDLLKSARWLLERMLNGETTVEDEGVEIAEWLQWYKEIG